MDAKQVSQDAASFASTARSLRRRSCWAMALGALSLLAFSRSPALADEPSADAAAPEAARANPLKLKAGKLVICGGGALPDELGRRFIELAGGSAARLVIVTTASVLADTDRIETKLAFWRRQQVADLTVLHTRSRETANQAEFAEPLKQASGVWFIGGNQNWLTDTYLGTVTEREIRGVLERDGVVGGTSAGAAIMSPIMICRDKPDLEEGPGFGFLPGTVVDQHFLKRNRQARLLRVLDSHPDLVGFGIDEGTALVVDGPNASVLGESQVMVCSPNVPDQPPQVRPLKAGAQFDLAAMRDEALSRRVAVEEVAQRPAPEPAEASPALSDSAVSVSSDDGTPTASSEVTDAEKVGQ